jgi:hypothetical protein
MYKTPEDVPHASQASPTTIAQMYFFQVLGLMLLDADTPPSSHKLKGWFENNPRMPEGHTGDTAGTLTTRVVLEGNATNPPQSARRSYCRLFQNCCMYE